MLTVDHCDDENDRRARSGRQFRRQVRRRMPQDRPSYKRISGRGSFEYLYATERRIDAARPSEASGKSRPRAPFSATLGSLNVSR
jgi:hypothetical protein